MGQRFVKEGTGWRLGWDESSSSPYQGLLAGSSWAIELTAEEFRDFCRLTQQLTQTMATMASELMDEERITCEAESNLMWLEADGFPEAFALRFIVQSGRGCEGGWPASASREVLQAITQLSVF
ncbi:MAG: DUF1818 family protein [Leptolyngbyaceae cyanobacterium SM2_5_2]|nr:DUF1818 family protein [Leptolyngbyaceae cyanobacterium SM2_5_2]